VFGGGYVHRFLWSGLTGCRTELVEGACRPGHGAGTRHAPFWRVTEPAAPTAGSTRSPSRDVRATPRTVERGRDGSGHRREHAPGNGGRRYAPGHPCCGGTGCQWWCPGRRVVSGYSSRIRVVGELAGFGPVERVGVEGTGAYGAGLARHLRSLGVEVIEVDRARRWRHRSTGWRVRCRCDRSMPW
jgi:hypothetical protein